MKLAAFADCHIGSYGKKLDPETGLNARLLDTAASLRFVAEDARDRQVDGMLFGGDLFRNAKPTPTELDLAWGALKPAALPYWGIEGNHDIPRSSHERSSLVPVWRALKGADNRLFDRPELVKYPSFQIAALPYPNRAQLAARLPDYANLSPEEADRLIGAHLDAILRGLADQLDPSLPSVLLAHLSIDLAAPGAERGVMAGRDITIPLTAVPEEFTFAVFGHIHYAQDFGQYGRPNVFYAGSTDRIDFGEEGQAKSYVLMDLEAGTWERVPIPCREYCTVHYEFGDIGGTSFITAADDSNPNINGSICRVKISRPGHVKPGYAEIQASVETLGAWDFRGFIEDVQRTAAVRSEEITRAQTIEELLGVWHAAKGCEVPVNELVAAGGELEKAVMR